MANREQEPRQRDEWRVEVNLDQEQHGHSLGERLHTLKLDDEARERLGGSVIVTRDGTQLFLYAWHEQSAHEAEQVVRDLLEEDSLAGSVELRRWHPVEETWRPASEPLPETPEQEAEERRRHEQAEIREREIDRDYDWQVILHAPHLRSTQELAQRFADQGLPVKRRFQYLMVGALTEEDAVALGKRLEVEAPEGTSVGVRGNPDDLPLPVFVQLGSMKPGFMRDLGI